MTNPLPAQTSAPDPGLRGLMSLGAGLVLGRAPTSDGRVTLWLVDGDEVCVLDTLPTRPLERAHSVEPVVDLPRGRALFPVGDTMFALDLSTRRLSVAWALPTDDGLWSARCVGPLLLARGRRLWAWDLASGALVWSGPEERRQDFVRASDGTLLGVTIAEEPTQARLIVEDLQRGSVRAELTLGVEAGGSVGSVAFVRGGEALLCARRGGGVGALFDEALWVEAGRERSLGVWSASLSPTPYGLAACAPLDEDWAFVAGRDAGGQRYSTLIHLHTASHHPVPHRAQLAPGGWALGADGALSNAQSGVRWQLTPTPARALCLAVDGRSASALVAGRVLGWAW
ncbi:hypothetical protein L6R49_13660 [Myxococcota bacterium]|nr:hypothetical protein [Myxococcota bacterium]